MQGSVYVIIHVHMYVCVHHSVYVCVCVQGSVNFKFGVLYAKSGQTTDNELYGNGQSSYNVCMYCRHSEWSYNVCMYCTHSEWSYNVCMYCTHSV